MAWLSKKKSAEAARGTVSVSVRMNAVELPASIFPHIEVPFTEPLPVSAERVAELLTEAIRRTKQPHLENEGKMDLRITFLGGSSSDANTLLSAITAKAYELGVNEFHEWGFRTHPFFSGILSWPESFPADKMEEFFAFIKAQPEVASFNVGGVPGL
jgi:hypothetical protein